MYFSSKELKRQARETLNGRYGLPMLAFSTSWLLQVVVTFPFEKSFQQNPDNLQTGIFLLASVIIILLTGILDSGLRFIHLNLARNKKTHFYDLFFFFTRRPDRFIIANFILLIIACIGVLPTAFCVITAFLTASLPWIVASVLCAAIFIPLACVLSYSYALVFFLLVDHDDIDIRNAFRMSRKLMRGKKGKLFYIDLSFIGMNALCILSLGIGYLWIRPYMLQTQTAFYRNIIMEVS